VYYIYRGTAIRIVLLELRGALYTNNN
jgi:hypothetical protein